MTGMVQIPEHATPTQAHGNAPGSMDRRRPGRSPIVSDALIPLLRRDSLLGAAPASPARDDLAPMRGIGVSVVLGLALWAGLIAAGYWLFVA